MYQKNPCSQRYVREEIITSQIKEKIKKVSLPDDWSDWMIKELGKRENPNQTNRRSFSLKRQKRNFQNLTRSWKN